MRPGNLQAALVTVACAALVMPASSFGHAGIESYTPKRGSVTDRDLRYVRLTFAARIAGGSIVVRTAGGRQVSRGRGSLVRDGRQLRARLEDGLRAGRYTASARQVHTDGHVLETSWSFRLR